MKRNQGVRNLNFINSGFSKLMLLKMIFVRTSTELPFWESAITFPLVPLGLGPLRRFLWKVLTKVEEKVWILEVFDTLLSFFSGFCSIHVVIHFLIWHYYFFFFNACQNSCPFGKDCGISHDDNYDCIQQEFNKNKMALLQLFWYEWEKFFDIFAFL